MMEYESRKIEIKQNLLQDKVKKKNIKKSRKKNFVFGKLTWKFVSNREHTRQQRTQKKIQYRFFRLFVVLFLVEKPRTSPSSDDEDVVSLWTLMENILFLPFSSFSASNFLFLTLDDHWQERSDWVRERDYGKERKEDRSRFR